MLTASTLLGLAAVAAGQVSQAWVAREFLPGAGPVDDGAVEGVIYDPNTWPPQRFLFVTGWVTEASGATRFATYKYDADHPAGSPPPHVAPPAYFPPLEVPLQPGQVFKATGIALGKDPDGSVYVYVTGVATTPNQGLDYITIKYEQDLSQSLAWPDQGDGSGVRRYNGPANVADMPVDVGADGDGQVWVTGTSAGVGTGNDIATLKYEADGSLSADWPAFGPFEPQGVRRYNGPGNGQDSAAGLALVPFPQPAPDELGPDDPAAGVAVLGTSYGGTITKYDYATIRYNDGLSPPYGAGGWLQRYNALNNGNDIAAAIVSGARKVFVTGFSEEVPGSAGGGMTILAAPRTDYSTLAYNDFDGSPFWPDVGWGPGVRMWDGPGHSYDSARTILFRPRPDPRVWVAGATASGGDYSFGTIQYDATVQPGVLRWQHVFGAYVGLADDPASLAADLNGVCYVAGWSQNPQGNQDFTTIRLSPGAQGVPPALMWGMLYNPAGGFDRARCVLHVPDTMRVYTIVRSYQDAVTRIDFVTVCSTQP